MSGFPSGLVGATSGPMKRRYLLAALAMAPFAALALGNEALAAPVQMSAQDQADIQRIESYLNGLRTLKAHFVQVAPDGGISEGTAWLERPGRMRFEYDPPSPLLLVAGHGLVVFHDASVDQTSNIPLGQTPLGILLSDNVRLSGAVTVTNLTRMPGQLQVTLIRTATPGEGSLTLIFADGPLQLRQWVVVDAQRRETRVSLLNAQLGGSFDPSLFTFIDPRSLDSGSRPGGGN
jgi:outer membrane lipoprotein-sorting protein